MHDWNIICSFAFLFSYSLLDCDGVSTIEGESLIQDSNSDVVSITYGPHKKLSRGDEMYNIREEFGMAKEKRSSAQPSCCWTFSEPAVKHLDAQHSL